MNTKIINGFADLVIAAANHPDLSHDDHADTVEDAWDKLAWAVEQSFEVHAADGNPDWAPDCRIGKTADLARVAVWRGFFTHQRWVMVQLFPDRLVLSWDTGTGKSSWFLGPLLGEDHAPTGRRTYRRPDQVEPPSYDGLDEVVVEEAHFGGPCLARRA